MSSMFSSLFSRDPTKDFNYEIVQKLNRNADKELFTLCKGKKRGSDEEVSIFLADFKSLNPNEANLTKSCAKRLKMLKHPSILTYLDSLETDSLVQLVTETVMPLEVYLETLRSVDSERKELLISWGLYQVTTVVKFLTQDAKLVHNNLHLQSVYVNKSGDWKLFGLEYMFGGAGGQDSSPSKPYSLEKYLPPEIKSSGSPSANSLWSTDSWGLACLIWEIFNGAMTSSQGGIATLKTPKAIPKALHATYAKLITSNPSQRSSPEQFIENCRKPHGFMKNKLVDTLLFLEEFQLKDAREKSQFFNHLNECLDLMPNEMQKHKILPQLSNAFEFGNAGSAVLAPLLKISKILNDAEYQQQIVPCVVKLFSSSDRATRVKLLQQVESFIEHLQPAIVNDKIFPHLISGFSDTNAAVREVSVKAVIHFAPKLNYNNLNVEIMKHFARLQSKDDQPGIRTNTSICLGKIASYVNSQVRQRVLISAFTRALKDPFPPARIAGILALSATQQYYLLNEVAFKILPALSACTMDPEKQVRDQAFKSIKGFLDKLEKASENPELIIEMESQVNANTGGVSESVPQWASWAFTALSSKFYKPPAGAQKPSQDPAAGIQTIEKLDDTNKTKIIMETKHKQDERNIMHSRSTAKPDKDDWKEESGLFDESEGWGDIEDIQVEESSTKGGGWDVEDNEPWESLDEQQNVQTKPVAKDKPVSKAFKPSVKKSSFDDGDSDDAKRKISNVSSVKQDSVGWEVDDDDGSSEAWNENWTSSASKSKVDFLFDEDAEKVNRKEQAAQRAQQRKAEMEQKRLAKQSGPLKLGARKVN